MGLVGGAGVAWSGPGGRHGWRLGAGEAARATEVQPPVGVPSQTHQEGVVLCAVLVQQLPDLHPLLGAHPATE